LLFANRIAKDLPDFFLHAPSVACGAALEPLFDDFFQLPDDYLGHHLAS
jgi:hypothetical protein